MDLKISNLQVADTDSAFSNGLIQSGWLRFGFNKGRMFYIWPAPQTVDYWN